MYHWKNINFIRHDKIDSTNTWAKTHAESLPKEMISCIVAKEQTKGRGRNHRTWVSPAEGNLYASLFFRVENGSTYLGNLGQLFSLAAVSVFQRHDLPVRIKWPNDLVINKKKLGGILIETVPMQTQRGVILGFGININMSKESLAGIDQAATSLFSETGHTWNVEAVLEELLIQFLADLQILQRGGFHLFAEKYQCLLSHLKESIRCTDGKRTFEGICDSIEPDGRMNLILSSGEKISLSAGEISGIRSQGQG